MKTNYILFFLLVLFLTQCQYKKSDNSKIETQSNSSVVAYDEYSKEESISFNKQKYYLSIEVKNQEEKIIKLNDGRYNDREVVINLKSNDEGIFNIKIEKNAFQKYYSKEEIDSLLIYNCHLETSNDTFSIFKLICNICVPETDNCRFFNLSFKENGDYKISEEEMSDEGEE